MSEKAKIYFKAIVTTSWEFFQKRPCYQSASIYFRWDRLFHARVSTAFRTGSWPVSIHNWFLLFGRESLDRIGCPADVSSLKKNMSRSSSALFSAPDKAKMSYISPGIFSPQLVVAQQLKPAGRFVGSILRAMNIWLDGHNWVWGKTGSFFCFLVLNKLVLDDVVGLLAWFGKQQLVSFESATVNLTWARQSRVIH